MSRISRVFATAATLPIATSLASPAASQEEKDQQLGNVHFATSCNETAQRRFNRGMRYQHSFWYRQSKEIFEQALQADPECRWVVAKVSAVVVPLRSISATKNCATSRACAGSLNRASAGNV